MKILSEILEDIKSLIKKFKEPIDKEELKVLIIEGLVPDAGKLLEYLERWV